MYAFFGAISVIGFIVGIVLMILGWIKKKKYKGWLIALISLVVFIAAVAMTPNDEKATNDNTHENTTMNKTAGQTKTVTWEEKVKEVAASKGTPTEKFDEISAYAKNFKPTKDEIAEFEQYIIEEYKNGKYLKNISNDEYMLGNIFKSQVVNQYYGDDKPIGSFAFDFWQNTKYVYRGVDKIDSESTLSNEKQMDKALDEMGK